MEYYCARSPTGNSRRCTWKPASSCLLPTSTGPFGHSYRSLLLHWLTAFDHFYLWGNDGIVTWWILKICFPLNQASASPIDFDYLGYFFLRYDEYKKQRDPCFALAQVFLSSPHSRWPSFGLALGKHWSQLGSVLSLVCRTQHSVVLF